MRFRRRDRTELGDAQHRLERALRRARQRVGQPQAVQLVAQPMSTTEYARWRAGWPHPTPPLESDRRAMVVVGVLVEDAPRFLAGGQGRVVGAAAVGVIRPDLPEPVALRLTLAAWLEHHDTLTVQLAPPILQRVSGPWRGTTVEPLDLSWDLPAGTLARRQ